MGGWPEWWGGTLETGQTYEEEAEVTHESKIQASSYPQLRSMTTRE